MKILGKQRKHRLFQFQLRLLSQVVLSKLKFSLMGPEAESSPCHARLPPNIASVCFFLLPPDTPRLTPEFSCLESLALPPVGVLVATLPASVPGLESHHLRVLAHFLVLLSSGASCHVTPFLRPRMVHSALCILTPFHIFICI